jgi:hypothetical protein
VTEPNGRERRGCTRQREQHVPRTRSKENVPRSLSQAWFTWLGSEEGNAGGEAMEVSGDHGGSLMPWQGRCISSRGQWGTIEWLRWG